MEWYYSLIETDPVRNIYGFREENTFLGNALWKTVTGMQRDLTEIYWDFEYPSTPRHRLWEFDNMFTTFRCIIENVSKIAWGTVDVLEGLYTKRMGTPIPQ
jgi:hypothetical protein